MAQARRQVVLKTFAAAEGDVARASKLLGVPEAELRAELASVLGSGNGGGPAAALHDEGDADDGADLAPQRGRATRPAAPKAAPPKPKKR
jgi:hypothetical protein